MTGYYSADGGLVVIYGYARVVSSDSLVDETVCVTYLRSVVQIQKEVLLLVPICLRDDVVHYSRA
jgi:hypothetical protein